MCYYAESVLILLETFPHMSAIIFVNPELENDSHATHGYTHLRACTEKEGRKGKKKRHIDLSVKVVVLHHHDERNQDNDMQLRFIIFHLQLPLYQCAFMGPRTPFSVVLQMHMLYSMCMYMCVCVS